MSIVAKLFGLSPYPELWARKIYYRFIREKKKNKKTNGSKHYENASNDKVEINELVEHLRKIGIKKGDLLIVHSSAEGLQSLNCRENILLDSLFELVGETGTIALPAFPDETKLKEQDGIKIYDPTRSLAWTGMLPNLMLRKKGAIRSRYPYNPLVAYGPLAKDMMDENLETAYAHGKNSCWGYCVEKHAKILFLGIPAYHSCTILHTIEDYQPEFWPQGWYEEKEYFSKYDGDLHNVKVKVRDLKWAQYMSERYTERKYIKADLIKVADFKGISIRYIEDSNTFINNILKDWKKYRFFYLPHKLLNEDKRIKKI